MGKVTLTLFPMGPGYPLFPMGGGQAAPLSKFPENGRLRLYNESGLKGPEKPQQVPYEFIGWSQ